MSTSIWGSLDGGDDMQWPLQRGRDSISRSAKHDGPGQVGSVLRKKTSRAAPSSLG